MVFFWIAAVVALDQVTKKMAVKQLDERNKKYVLDGKVSLRLVYNRGAFLGLFKDRPTILHLFTLVSLSLIVIIGLPYWISGSNRMTGTGLALILAGAMGNYADRVLRDEVVDFVAFAPNHKVHFNLADFAIFIGAGLMVIGEFIGK